MKQIKAILRSLQDNYANSDRYLNNDAEVASLVNSNNVRTGGDQDMETAILNSVQSPEAQARDERRSFQRRYSLAYEILSKKLSMVGITTREEEEHNARLERINQARNGST